MMLKMSAASEYALLSPLNYTSNISYTFNDTKLLSNRNINFTTFIKLYDSGDDEQENFTIFLNQSDDISIRDIPEKNYWALILICFPILTIFGNILVIASVYRERTLQTVTNYFIVSLALADLLVAVVVMPFAVYVLVNGKWGLPDFVCDFYIAMDVMCSTSSIFNLVAISIDRYIAVTQPIKYAKHKNNRRVWLTIVLVWAISVAIGSPIVLGLNNTPDRLADLCLFYSSDFIIYSSLSSFYIPCIIMVFLYYNIFKALSNRAKKARAARKPHLSEMKPGIVIENVAQTRRLAETTLVASSLVPSSLLDEGPTCTGSGSQDDEAELDEEGDRSPGSGDECGVLPNDKCTEFILATVVEEAVAVAPMSSSSILTEHYGNHDSGYAASSFEVPGSSPNSPLKKSETELADFKNNNTAQSSVLTNSKPHALRSYSVEEEKTTLTNKCVKRTQSTQERSGSDNEIHSKKERKASAASRFTIYKVNKASRKKREKSSAKKERKATKTLAIVLAVFLFCWVPFFTCNIMDAICTKLGEDCQPGVTWFIFTTWLGYMNSFVNPVIYTIFNPEFRKAFKKLMCLAT